MGLRSALADARGGRVVFVSHCLLNENTRYPGGAFRPGAVREVVDPYLDDGVGIVQMPCPEQVAWGGVAKTRLTWFWGRPRWRWLASVGLPAFAAYTRLRYRMVARGVARQIADYRSAGAEVVAVVGVGMSPSCGVETTVNLAATVGAVVGCPPASLDRVRVNTAVAAAAQRGRGVFIAELDRALARHGIDLEFREHDLRAEWGDATGSGGVST